MPKWPTTVTLLLLATLFLTKPSANLNSVSSFAQPSNPMIVTTLSTTTSTRTGIALPAEAGSEQITTDKTTYFQGNIINYIGSGFTPGGAIGACITIDDDLPPLYSVLCVGGEPNADEYGDVNGSFIVGTNVLVGPQEFWVQDLATDSSSPPVQLTILPNAVGEISYIASLTANSEWFVLPDFMAGVGSVVHHSASKCGGVAVALETDVYSATYFFGALTNTQNEVLDTNSTYVSQSTSSCGQPTTNPSQPLVTVAGPVVNEVVHYYESTTAPLYYNLDTGCIVNRATSTNVDCSIPTPTNDVFLMEAFTDSAGRTVFIIYGRAWPGTLAGLEYIVNFVLRNPSGYPASWYVYRWQDATSGPSANSIPDPGDTYTQIASG